MKKILVFIFVILSVYAYGQSKSETLIRQQLKKQTESWNQGNIEGFMETYWKSDSLLFIGNSGLNRGWQNTLNNYRKGYPDTAAMGKLAFDIIMVKKLSSKYYYVVGKWMLTRSIGNLSGHYDLLFRKIKGKWFIVADHSS